MSSNQPTSPFLDMGFRPFFLGAAVFATLSMLLWAGVYLFAFAVPIDNVTMYEWHAHEMFFGYALAVIAGFLLTSVRTWTRLPTAHGLILLLLFLLWAVPRMLFMFGTSYIEYAAIFDITFALCLSTLLALRIVQAKQWKQLGIIAILLLITASNIVFFLGVFGLVKQGVTWGIYAALYLVIALIMTMGRRVIPFFIERAAGSDVLLKNSKWLDISNIVGFLAFAINEIFVGRDDVSAYLALSLFVINSIRLLGWFHPIIFKQSLLWSLYFAFWMITLGFLLLAIPYFAEQTFSAASIYLAIHAFTLGGIAVITLGMMARVSLGHTGNNVYQPPRLLKYAIAAIALSALVRVLIPYFEIWPYYLLIGLSKLLWVIAFTLFIFIYAPLLCRAKQH